MKYVLAPFALLLAAALAFVWVVIVGLFVLTPCVFTAIGLLVLREEEAAERLMDWSTGAMAWPFEH